MVGTVIRDTPYPRSIERFLFVYPLSEIAIDDARRAITHWANVGEHQFV